MLNTAALFVALTALSGPDEAPGENAPLVITIDHVVVSSIDELELPAERDGRLAKLSAPEGRPVEEGQVIAEIDDRDVRLALDVARLEHQAAAAESESDIRVRAAVAAEGVAQAEFIRSQGLFQRKPPAVSEAELDRRRLSQQQAELQIELAKHEYNIAGIQTELAAKRIETAQLEIDRTAVVAPWSGIVLARLRHEGEWVTRGQPVVRLLRMDRLRVEGFVRLRDASPSQIDGARAIVRIDVGGGMSIEREGTVDYVSSEIEGEEYRIWVEVENVLEVNPVGRRQWLLRPGMFGAMAVEELGQNIATDPSEDE